MCPSTALAAATAGVAVLLIVNIRQARQDTADARRRAKLTPSDQ